jgi:hypothetical protein
MSVQQELDELPIWSKDVQVVERWSEPVNLQGGMGVEGFP